LAFSIFVGKGDFISEGFEWADVLLPDKLNFYILLSMPFALEIPKITRPPIFLFCKTKSRRLGWVILFQKGMLDLTPNAKRTRL